MNPPTPTPTPQPLHEAAAARTLRHVVADDAHAAAVELDGWQQRYQQLTPGAFRAEMSQVTYGDVHVFREQTSQSLLEEGEAAKGYVALALPDTQCQGGWFSGYAMDGQTLLWGRSMAMRTPRQLDLAGLTVPLPALQRAVAQAGGEPERLDRMPPVRAVTKRASREFRAVLLSVLATAAMDAEVFSNRFVESAMRDALLLAAAMVLVGEGNAGTDPLPTVPARRRLVADAYQMIRSAPEQPWSILSLCERLGVSRRTLQYSFNEVTGLSPLDFVRAVRMNGVRQALRAGVSDSVGAAAASFGFQHLPRFAAQYRAFFGELPSATLARR